jgi:hypothetical protein
LCLIAALFAPSLALGLPSKAAKPTDKWAWIRIDGGVPGISPPFDVHTGETSVTIRRGRLHTLLHWEARQGDKVSGGDYLIDGIISGNDIYAEETEQYTDGSPQKCRGKIYSRTDNGDKYTQIYLVNSLTYIYLSKIP